MAAFSAPSSSAQNTRLKLWHVLPIAAALHGLLLWIPIKTASNPPMEKPNAVPPSVKVSTLPQPVVTPSPLVSPPSPIVKTQPAAVAQPTVVQQPRPITAVQSPPPIVEQRVIERIVEKPTPVEKPAQQASVKPKAEPEKPIEPVQPQPKFDTTADVLSNLLGGQSCGDGCIETTAVSTDVISQLTQRFGHQPQEIRDRETDALLGYAIVNAQGKQEFMYRVQRTRQIAGKSVEISVYRSLPELINDQNRLIQMGIS